MTQKVKDINAIIDIDRASYVIYKTGSITNAKNGTTGEIDYSTTDANAVIKDAVDATESGMIFIKNGTYNATIDLSNKAIDVMGENRYGTILSNAGDVIRIANDTDMIGIARQSIRNIMLDGVNNAGNGLYLDNVSRCSFDDLYIQNCNVGINLNRTIANHFKNPLVRASNIGMKFDSVNTNAYNNANIISGGEISDGNPGVCIYGNNINNVFLGTVIEGFRLTQVIIRSALIGDIDFPSIKNIFYGCWFEAPVENQIFVDIMRDVGSTYPYANMISNSNFVGIFDFTALRNPGNRNHFEDNMLLGPTGKNGIINISGDNNVIANNNVNWNNLLVLNTGKGNIFTGNEKYKTESNVLSGTFDISSVGVKTVKIAHGLNVTPAAQDCSITVIENTTVDDWAYSLLKIASTNATSVTVKINISKGSSTSRATAKLGLRVSQ